MTDTDIIELAKLRFEQLKRDVGLSFGDFDMTILIKGVVHDGKMTRIEVQFPEQNCSRKITL